MEETFSHELPRDRARSSRAEVVAEAMIAVTNQHELPEDAQVVDVSTSKCNYYDHQAVEVTVEL